MWTTRSLEFAPPDFKQNRMYTKAAVKQNGFELKYAGKYQDDAEIVLVALQQSGKHLYFASNRLKNDFNIVMEAVNQNGLALDYASVDMKSNKEIVTAAVKEKGISIKFASMSLKNDPSILYLVMQTYGEYFTKIPEIFQNNYEIVKEAIRYDGNNLQYASNEMKNCFDIVLEALKSSPLNLQYASIEMKNNFKIVSQAVLKNGLSLEYASKELQNNFEIIEKAIINNGEALLYVNDQWKENKSLVLKAVQKKGLALQYASEKLKNDLNIVMEAVNENGYALTYAPLELQNNLELIILAIEQTQNYQAFLTNIDTISNNNHQFFHNNLNLMKSMIKQNGLLISTKFIEFQNHEEIAILAVQQNGLVLQYLDQNLKNNHYEINLKAVEQNTFALKYISENFQSNEMIIYEALKKNYRSFIYISSSSSIFSNESFMLKILSQYGEIISFPNVCKNEMIIKNRNMIIAALNSYPNALQYASKLIQSSDILLTQLALEKGECFSKIHENLKTNFDLIEAAVKMKSSNIFYAKVQTKYNKSEKLMSQFNRLLNSKYYASRIDKNMIRIVKIAIAHDGLLLDHMPKTIRNDRDIVLSAVRQNGYALGFASTTLQDDLDVVLTAVASSNNKNCFQKNSTVHHPSPRLRCRRGELKLYLESLLNEYSISCDTFLYTFLLGIKPSSSFKIINKKILQNNDNDEEDFEDMKNFSQNSKKIRKVSQNNKQIPSASMLHQMGFYHFQAFKQNLAGYIGVRINRFPPPPLSGQRPLYGGWNTILNAASKLGLFVKTNHLLM